MAYFMNNSYPKVHAFMNEKILTYLPGTQEHRALYETYRQMYEDFLDIPLIIGGKRITTEKLEVCTVPHKKDHKIGQYHMAGKKEAEQAIEAALEARKNWVKLPWDERIAIFLRAAELASGPWRYRLNAATMLAQSKTYYQAEIDSAAELVDFLRANASSLAEIYSEQPYSPSTIWNRMDYRPLEGYVFAVSPFNFTSIAMNLPTAPAMAGNVVVWKPSGLAVYSAYYLYLLLEEAGLPAGVINFLPGNSRDIGDVLLKHYDLAGIHFTGSTKTFRDMTRTVGNNIDHYKTFPRLIGETGGKNYVLAHPSADIKLLAQSLRDGAFEYQGQKCSAASRAYIPKSIWPALKEELFKCMAEIKVGDVGDYNTFMGAVIDENAYKGIVYYIEYARKAKDAEIIYGGTYCDDVGYFIDPTIILTRDPKFKTMEEELFGPVLTVYVYEESFDDILTLVDETSPYGLTGSIFAEDRYAIVKASERLVDSAGNFYINIRPTGAVVGQQPFGGGRASGTNDKAGARNNMMRWTSPRVIKEEFRK